MVCYSVRNDTDPVMVCYNVTPILICMMVWYSVMSVEHLCDGVQQC
jgi:hypothetical protein